MLKVYCRLSVSFHHPFSMNPHMLYWRPHVCKHSFPEIYQVLCNKLTNIAGKAFNNIPEAVKKLVLSALLGHSCERFDRLNPLSTARCNCKGEQCIQQVVFNLVDCCINVFQLYQIICIFGFSIFDFHFGIL